MKTNIQAHPFHLVEPSPWPLAASLALLTTTISGVMYFNNYANGGLLLTLGLISTVFSMSLWFRDIIIEGKNVPSLNLAVCWELLRVLSTFLFICRVKILKIGQSAGNQKDSGKTRELSSLRKNNSIIFSRILRDYTPSINKFTDISGNTINNNNITKSNIQSLGVIPDIDLGSYLAGLTEGDGYIEINLNPKEGKRVLNPRFVFTFNENNLFLYEHISNRIGSGFFIKVKPNSMHYVVGDIKGVIILTELMNGYFRTPKIDTFHKLINNLNITRSLDIPLLPLDISSLDSNAWFAGFSEADSYFNIKIISNKLKPENNPKISCRFTIEQRQIDKRTGLSCEPFMSMLAQYFEVSLLTITRNNPKFSSPASSYYFSVETISKLNKIIYYFDKYPLIKIKGLDYKDFLIGYNMILNKEHLTDVGIEKIKNIVAGMNKNRK